MRKDEIPRDQWPAFFDWFMITHRGHLCTLAFVDGDEDNEVRLHPLLLAGVGHEDDVGPERIRVLLSDWEGKQLACFIHGPSHVSLAHTPEDVSETLRIDGAGGRAVMRFQAPD